MRSRQNQNTQNANWTTWTNEAYGRLIELHADKEALRDRVATLAHSAGVQEIVRDATAGTVGSYEQTQRRVRRWRCVCRVLKGIDLDKYCRCELDIHNAQLNAQMSESDIPEAQEPTIHAYTKQGFWFRLLFNYDLRRDQFLGQLKDSCSFKDTYGTVI